MDQRVEPTKPWAEPSPWNPLVYHVNVEAGNYHVEATARVWVSDQWVVAFLMECGWTDLAYQYTWITADLDASLAWITMFVDRQFDGVA